MYIPLSWQGVHKIKHRPIERKIPNQVCIPRLFRGEILRWTGDFAGLEALIFLANLKERAWHSSSLCCVSGGRQPNRRNLTVLMGSSKFLYYFGLDVVCMKNDRSASAGRTAVENVRESSEHKIFFRFLKALVVLNGSRSSPKSRFLLKDIFRPPSFENAPGCKLFDCVFRHPPGAFTYESILLEQLFGNVVTGYPPAGEVIGTSFPSRLPSSFSSASSKRFCSKRRGRSWSKPPWA